MDFPLNYKYLTAEEHRGNKSPHMNREIDLQYKRELEEDLRLILIARYYSLDELIQILSLKPNEAYKAFKQVRDTGFGMDKEDIIFRLLGGKFYIWIS